MRSHTCTISISHTHVHTSSLLTHIRLLSRAGDQSILSPTSRRDRNKDLTNASTDKEKKNSVAFRSFLHVFGTWFSRERGKHQENLYRKLPSLKPAVAPLFFVSSYLPWLFPGDTEVFGRTSHKSRRRWEPGQSWNVLIACPVAHAKQPPNTCASWQCPSPRRQRGIHR